MFRREIFFKLFIISSLMSIQRCEREEARVLDNPARYPNLNS